MQSATIAPEIATARTGHLPYVVAQASPADQLPVDPAALLLLSGAAQDATAVTPREHATAALDTFTGQAVIALRALALEHQAAGRDVRQELLDDAGLFGAIGEAIEDALNTVMREYPRA
ncbi:hypothetical protein ACWD01_13050 [Streptomyces sp. NPDC002835]